MKKATSIRLFMVLLVLVMLGAIALREPLIILGVFALIGLTAIFSFEMFVRDNAKTLAKAKLDSYTKFTYSLFKEGVAGVILYGIILFAIFSILNIIFNAVISKPLLNHWINAIWLTIFFLAYQYSTYSNYSKLKKTR